MNSSTPHPPSPGHSTLWKGAFVSRLRAAFKARSAWPHLLVGGSLFALGCSQHEGPASTNYFSRDTLLDPKACKGCHPNHYQDWLQSMHAYAADDPVFVAMNQRGQRETNHTLGAFCVTCHAPMAVREGLTTDGLNLAAVPQKYKGVTCFFCHTVTSVDGTHNAALSLSSDNAMRGEYSDPIRGAPHASTYSTLHDRDVLTSASVCGTCHDIVVNPTNAPIERTFCEWSHSAYNTADPEGRATCAQCHMYETPGPIAQVPSAPSRRFHSHDFPGVDVSLDPGAGDAGAARTAVQHFLASSFQGAVCVTQGGGIRVQLDPVFLGHDWPSGAAQDRRAWAEVIAYRSGNVIYQSGVVPDAAPVLALQNDPDLWLLRDQMFDTQDNPANMFWQAATIRGNEIPALATFDMMDPRWYQTHVVQLFPRNTRPLPQMPDRVTFRMRLQPVGLDVLNDLVASGDLDPSVIARMPTWDVSFLDAGGGIVPALEWTAEAAAATKTKYPDEFDLTMATCVATATFKVGVTKVPAASLSTPPSCPP